MDIRQEIPIKSFSVAAYVCRTEKRLFKFLLLKRKTSYLNESWQMISGRVEEGEKGWQAAVREIKEETGLVPDRFYSANVAEIFYVAEQNCINIVPVFVAFIDLEQQVKLSAEHSDYKWVEPLEAKRYLAFYQQREILDQIYKVFSKPNLNPFLKIDLA